MPPRLSPIALESVESFNSKVRSLTATLAGLFPDDAMVERIRKRVILALDADPLIVIRQAGPYLLKYSDQIYGKNTTFFLENDYDADIKAGVDKGRIDAVAYMLPRLKLAIGGFEHEKKMRYFAIIEELLDLYVEFSDEQRLAAEAAGLVPRLAAKTT